MERRILLRHYAPRYVLRWVVALCQLEIDDRERNNANGEIKRSGNETRGENRRGRRLRNAAIAAAIADASTKLPKRIYVHMYICGVEPITLGSREGPNMQNCSISATAGPLTRYNRIESDRLASPTAFPRSRADIQGCAGKNNRQ